MTRVDTSGYGPSGDDLTSGKVHTRYAQRVLAFQPSRLGSWSSPVSRTAVLSVREERCFVVPKGQARIAQRFNAGSEAKKSRVPKGRLRSNLAPNPSIVPSGLACHAGSFPALKRRAILKMSLRDTGTRRPPFPRKQATRSISNVCYGCFAAKVSRQEDSGHDHLEAHKGWAGNIPTVGSL